MNNGTFDMLLECEHIELFRKGSTNYAPLSNVLKALGFSSSGIFLNSEEMNAMVSHDGGCIENDDDTCLLFDRQGLSDPSNSPSGSEPVRCPEHRESSATR